MVAKGLLANLGILTNYSLVLRDERETENGSISFDAQKEEIKI